MRVARPPSSLATAGFVALGLSLAALVPACSEQPNNVPSGTSVSSSGAGGCTDGTSCESQCVDLQTDPNNCGSCGRTCVVANGLAACEQGECALGACDEGWANCDGVADNGCEEPASCVDGSGCTTRCDTVGVLDCSDICAPVCSLSEETCNLQDDNCDGGCDEGALAGCRKGILRSFGPLNHFYTDDEAEAVALGQNIESVNYFYLYTAQVGDARPFFRCKKANDKRWMTTSTDCEGTAAPEQTMGYIAFEQECGAVPLYRLLNVGADAHFYTTNATERDNAINNLNFADQGIAGYVWQEP